MIEKLVSWVVKILEKHVALRFVISGGTSAVVDLIVLYILNGSLRVNYLLSSILAFLVAFGVSFTLHKFWTFKSHSDSTHRQAILYFGTSLFSLLLNTILMYLFVDHIFFYVLVHNMKVKVLLSQVIVGLLVAVFSFFISHRFVFKYKPQHNLEIDIT